MFTGIVQGLFQITEVIKFPGLIKYCVELPDDLLSHLRIGASISVDGVCQTAVQIEKNRVYFDAIQETLNRTTLNQIHVGRWVNIERSAKIGDEIGGHLLSGHIIDRAVIKEIQAFENYQTVLFQFHPQWMKYFFQKGYIAIDGASLTLVDVHPPGLFSVHLIPETLKVTTLGRKQIGDWVNVELDSQTQVIVDTVERVLAKN